MKLFELLKKINIVKLFLYGISFISFILVLHSNSVHYTPESFFQYAMPNAIVTGCGCIAIGIYEGKKNNK